MRFIKLFLLFVFSLLVIRLQYNAVVIYASDISFFDDFSSGNSLKWDLISNSCKYNGVPANWVVDTFKLRIDINGGSCSTFLMPKALTLDSNKSYSIEAKMTFLNSINMDRNLIVKFQDLHNWYGLHFIGTDIYLDKVVGGTEFFLPNKHHIYPFHAGEEYTIKAEVTQEDFKLYINGQLVYIVPDESPKFLNKTAGLAASAGGIISSSVLFDDIKIEQISTLPVPDLKQYTEPWGSMVYDMANIWSPGKDSIARYGCALTSATTILQYYGYTVTPDSLNTWLLNNHGYVSDGLVDWSAITKWVKLNHDINPLLTKLEYSRSPYDNSVLVNEIDASRPAIVKLVRPDNGTHFVVVTGKENSDFNINDPATTANLLSHYPASQYTRIDKFTPSNTDLSYLYFYTTPNIHLEAFDQNGVELTANPEIEGPYIDQTDQTLSLQNELLSVVVPKPNLGQYIFRLSGNGDYTTETRIYDIDANLTNVASEGSIKTGQIKTFVVNIGNISQSNEVNFEFIQMSINDAYHAGSIHAKGVYSVLIALLHAAKEATHQNKNVAVLKILDNLTFQVVKAGNQIDTEYAAKLQQYIGYLKESL